MTYDSLSSAHYYPQPLEELVGFMAAADYKTSGELLLVFRDSVGGQLALRLPHKLLGRLVEKLGSPPSPAVSTE